MDVVNLADLKTDPRLSRYALLLGRAITTLEGVANRLGHNDQEAIRIREAVEQIVLVGMDLQNLRRELTAQKNVRK